MNINSLRGGEVLILIYNHQDYLKVMFQLVEVNLII